MSLKKINVDPFYDFEDLIKALTPHGVNYWKEVVPATDFYVQRPEESEVGYRPVFDALPSVPGYVVSAYLDSLIRDNLPGREYGRFDLSEVVEAFIYEHGKHSTTKSNLPYGWYVLFKFSETGDTYATLFSEHPDIL